MGKLDVRIVGCRNLANTETFGTSDPYVVVSCEGKKYKTTVKDGQLNPEWNEKFTFMIADENSSRLEMEVWDSNTIKDSQMGRYDLSLAGLVRGKVSDGWYILNGCKSGEIRVRVMATDFGKIETAPMQPAPSAPPQSSAPPAMAGYPPQGVPPPAGPPGYYPNPGQQQPQQQGYPPQGAGYPPQGAGYPPPGPPGYPPQGVPPPMAGGYPPQGYPPQAQGPPPPGKTNYSNDDVVGQQISGATINTCDITNCTLWNCTIRKADFKGQNTLHNCDVREIDVYGRVILSGGRFEWGEVKPGGSIENQGCMIKDIDNYHG
eukprot:TRINITY_DN506_c4_g1_i1.p1 TRINITY_DN506_c4_g1~~TRINITY_DN506_c4_g1_i1.p1  ORF type:complete len:318 (+),score=69.82 TRINITY_DN506_c4_g1_i1:47-1000(+)